MTLKIKFHLPGSSYVSSSREDVSRFGDGSKGRGTSVSGVGRDFLGFTTVALNKMMSGFVEFAGLIGTVGMVSSITSS